MTNSDSGTASPAPENPTIFDSDRNGLCSVDDFLARMPDSESVKCQEFPRKLHGSPADFRVFWHPTGPNEPDPGVMRSAQLSVQVRIRCFLLEMNYCDASSKFTQFWAAKKSSGGESILTVLEQPFGMGSMDTRFCRYRYGCMKQSVQVGDYSAGPVGRVFTRGSPEYSNRMEFYSREDFPMMKYAKLSGKYLALPILEQDKCVGVLEFLSSVSCTNFQYINAIKKLEKIGLKTLSHTHSHFGDCHKVTHNLLISTLYKDVLNFIRIEHKLPLIQLWIPCSCEENGNINRLFCRWTGCGPASSCDYRYVKDETNLANGWHFVENGKGLVGRAYSQKKSCFLGDTSQLSISEYPLVHITRSRGLTACFAIPFKSLDPRLHDIILEVFLPPQQNSDHGNVGILLQSLLSAMAQNCQRSRAPRYTGSFPFELEPNKELCVQYSHSDGDNFVYFDVSKKCQYLGTCKALENGSERHHFQPSQEKHNDESYGVPVAPLNIVESSGESSLNSDAESLDGDQVQSCEILGSSRDDRRKFPDVAEKFEGRLPQHKRKELPKILSAVRLQDTDFVEVGGKVTQEPEVGTFPNKRARENELADANCVSTGAIGKAMSTGNEGCVSNNARENETAAAKSIPMGAKGKSVALGNDEINVMATYKDDTMLFPLSCNSGIKELRMELDDAFQFGAEKFKVKYEHDDGIWITLLRDKDFRFHVETLKASGQSTVKLSVFPVAL